MKTFSFTKADSGLIKITTDTPDGNIPAINLVNHSSIRAISKSPGGNRVTIDFNDTIYGDLGIDPAVDTVTIGTTTYDPGDLTVDQLLDAIGASTVFQKANSGSGGSGELTEGTLDISGLSAIDLSSVSTKDIVNLTSTNATETIDAITGIAAGKIVRLQPESGLEVTFTGTAVASAGAGDIVLPTTDFVADGTKRDYLSVTKDGSFVKQVDANNFI